MEKYKKIFGYLFAALVFLVVLWVLVISRLAPVVRFSFLSQLDGAVEAADALAVDLVADDGERIFFYNKNTLSFLRDIAETAEIQSVPANREAALVPPIYWSERNKLGSEGTLWFSLLGREYYFVPSPEESSRLRDYVEEVLLAGEGQGLSQKTSP